MFFLRSHINLTAAFLAGCLILCGCENDPHDLPGAKDNKAAALEELHNIESYLSQGGKVKGKLTSQLMFIYQSKNDSSYFEFPKKLHIDFYNDSLVIESVVDARYGKYFQSQNKVFLKDSVVVINKLKEDTLRTEELWWDQNSQKIYTSKPARFSQKDGTFNYGRNGMEAKQDLSDVLFNDNSGTLPIPKEDTLSIKKDTVIAAKDTAISHRKK